MTRIRLIALAFIVGAVTLLAVIAINRWNAAATSSAEARVERESGRAATQSGQDAVSTLGGASAREKGVDQITRENDNAIRNAPGAGNPIGDDVDRAGRVSLCRRAAYKNDPDCLQYTPAR